MAMDSLSAWLDWWEAKGKAISYCYIGVGGRVVTPGTASQAGTSVTVGGSSGSIPGNSAPNPNDGATGDGLDPIPVTATVVSSVTQSETMGTSKTPNLITTTTTYSNWTKTKTVESPSGWTWLTEFSDGSSQFVEYDRVSKETTTLLRDRYATATFVNDEQGNLISANIERANGTWDRLYREENDGHWIQINRGLDSTRTINFTDGDGKNIEILHQNDSKDIERYNEDGVLVYRSHYDSNDRSFTSVEHTENGSTIEIKRTSTTTDYWFSRGSVTEIDEIKTITHPIAGVTTHISRTRVETDLSGRTNAEPGRIERAADWLTDSIKDTWNQLTNDKDRVAPKTGFTQVSSENEKFSAAIHVGTLGRDGLSGDGILVGGAERDTLTGGTGTDLLVGGSDNDFLEGGLGGTTSMVGVVMTMPVTS